MKSILAWAVLSVVVLGAVVQVGCETSKPGAKNVVGGVVSYVDATPEQVVQAAEQVVEDMKLIRVSSASTTLDGQLTARTAQDKRVLIKATSEGANVSKVVVRVGAFGDEGISLQIIEQIEAKLDK